jgi:hypothetical protein
MAGAKRPATLNLPFSPFHPTPPLFLLTIHRSLFTALLILPFPLPFLLPLQDAASRCRLAKQNHCALQYRRPIADLEGIGELKLTSHCSLLTAPRVAIEPRGVIFNCSLLPASRFTAFLLLSFRSIAFLCALCASAVKFCFPASRFLFPLLLLPVIAENLIQNCQLNQIVVRSTPVFALYLQELQ